MKKKHKFHNINCICCLATELQERLIEMDREQVRLQSQVVTLQTQLVEQTREVEQARSNIRLEEGRLRAMQESIQSERMAVIKQVQLERSENDKAKVRGYIIMAE